MHTQNFIVPLEPEANAVNAILMASSIAQCVYITLCQFKILPAMLKPSSFRSFKVHDVCSCTVPFNKNTELFFVQNEKREHSWVFLVTQR